MKKGAFPLLLLAFLITQFSCGGGGGSSSSGSYRTNVEIVLGQTRTSSHETGTLLKESAQIPSSVTNIRFTISASDMQTIQRVVSVAGRTTISESFEVPVGPNRRFLVEALDSSGVILFQGEVFANIDERTLSLTISMVSTDPIAPVFSGLANISQITTTSLTLSWSAATDNVTPQANIQYLIYMSTISGGQNFSAPTFTTLAGATSYLVTGLNPSTAYYFVVRAKDERGNMDLNTVEKSATTSPPPDITAPQFTGLGSATAVSENQVDLSWRAATDNVTASSNIVYFIYVATTPGGQNFSTPTFTTAAGATSYSVTGLTPGTTYYFVVRARDEAGNIDTNTVERSATTQFVDLSITNVITSPTLSFTMNNGGNIDATNVVIFALYSDFCGQACQSVTVTVPAGGSVTIPSLPIPTTTVSAYKIIADPNSAISAESNRANNTTCLGSLCAAPTPTTCP